jgi:hypothetical protein
MEQPDGTMLNTYTLLTTAPNELVKPVHDRMPVIFETDVALQWLACGPETASHCLELLKPFPAEQITAYEVFPIVNNGKIDSPEFVKLLLRPLANQTIGKGGNEDSSEDLVGRFIVGRRQNYRRCRGIRAR